MKYRGYSYKQEDSDLLKWRIRKYKRESYKKEVSVPLKIWSYETLGRKLYQKKIVIFWNIWRFMKHKGESYKKRRYWSFENMAIYKKKDVTF